MKFQALLLTLALFTGLSLSAQPTMVSDISTLPTLVKNANPGDKFIIQDGNYRFEEKMVLECKGALNDSIYIEAQNKGAVTLNGFLELTGDYVVLSGFNFTGEYSEEDSSRVHYINVNCTALSNSRISDNFFTNNGRNRRRSVDVALQLEKGSNYNKVVRNYWEKPNAVSVYVVPPSHHNVISNNKFVNVRGKGRRWNVVKINNNIGRSAFASHTLVSNNLFFNFHKNEAEVISLKCSNNYVIDNFFYNCQGAVNFRQGESNSAIGNVFLKSYGVRIAGIKHSVSDNYFFKSTEVPIRIMKGGGSLQDLPMYIPVSEFSLLRNTVYNEQPFAVTIGNGGNRNNLAPSDLLFMGNKFYLKSGTSAYDWRMPSEEEGARLHTARIVQDESEEYDPATFDNQIILDLIKAKGIEIPEGLELSFE